MTFSPMPEAFLRRVFWARTQIGNAWLDKLALVLDPRDVDKLEAWDDHAISKPVHLWEKQHLKAIRIKDREFVESLRNERPEDWGKVKVRGETIAETDLEACRAYPMKDLVGEEDRILCPFHEDHDPSMYVYEDGVKCFVCGGYADQIGWLMVVHKMSFPQAVKRLLR